MLSADVLVDLHSIHELSLTCLLSSQVVGMAICVSSIQYNIRIFMLNTTTFTLHHSTCKMSGDAKKIDSHVHGYIAQCIYMERNKTLQKVHNRKNTEESC